MVQDKQTEVDPVTGVTKRKGWTVVKGIANVQAALRNEGQMAVVRMLAKAEGLDPTKLTQKQIDDLKARISKP